MSIQYWISRSVDTGNTISNEFVQMDSVLVPKTGGTFTGNVIASSFSGDGSLLTNVPDTFATGSTTLAGYDNISSIVNWDSFGELAGLRHCKVREQIKDIYDTQTGTTWSAYTLDERKVLSKYFIVDKTKRDEVLTQQEQDDYNHFKIYDFISDDSIERLGSNFNPKTTPKSIDYKKDVHQRFHPDYRFDRFGFLTGCTYYENLTVSLDAFGFTQFNFSGPVVEYKADYTFANNGYVSTRTCTRNWYMMDDTLSDDSKVTTKVYAPMVARDEARRRRKNLVNELIINAVGLFIMTSPDLNNVNEAEADAIPLLKEINPSISAYYEYGTKQDTGGTPCELILAISGSSYSRLDNFVPGTFDTVTIRQYVMSALDPQ